MMQEQKLLFALGLAQKAGKLASGDYAVNSALKTGKVKLLLIARDCAENSRARLVYLCEQQQVEFRDVLSRSQLGAAIGKAQRTAVAVLDDNFVKMILK